MSKKIYGIREKVPAALFLPLSLQHTFAMFGASVLVPILFKVNPGIVLLMNGIGTLFFILVTKGRAPAYLGSSFAFLGPALVLINSNPEIGFNLAQGGFVVVGLLGCVLAFIIYKFGTDWIDVVLPPAAMGSVVALIGFELVGNTIMPGPTGADLSTTAGLVVFLVTLGVAIFGSVMFKGFFSTIPILIAMIVGYITAIFFDLVDFTKITEVSVFTLPHFQMPVFDIKAILTMLPVLLVITSEHIGHQVVTSNIVGQDLLKDPGLHRSIFADNFSTAVSGFVGSVPTTTYGENIGVMAVTGVYSVYVIGGAAVISIIMAFIGPIAGFITSIPGEVIGGITFLLYGMIGASGIRLLVDSKIDYSKSKNLILTSVVFTTGLSGISIHLGQIEFRGMVLASLVAVVLSLIFHIFEKFDKSEAKPAK